MPTLAQQAIAESLREEAAERARTGAPRTLAQQAIDQTVAESGREALVDKLVDIAMSVLHHDASPDASATEWERGQLRMKFGHAIADRRF